MAVTATVPRSAGGQIDTVKFVETRTKKDERRADKQKLPGTSIYYYIQLSHHK